MNPIRFPMALFAFLGLGALLPAWMFFLNTYASNLSLEGQFIAFFTLPATAALFLASWLQPRSG